SDRVRAFSKLGPGAAVAMAQVDGRVLTNRADQRLGRSLIGLRSLLGSLLGLRRCGLGVERGWNHRDKGREHDEQQQASTVHLGPLLESGCAARASPELGPGRKWTLVLRPFVLTNPRVERGD